MLRGSVAVGGAELRKLRPCRAWGICAKFARLCWVDDGKEPGASVAGGVGVGQVVLGVGVGGGLMSS